MTVGLIPFKVTQYTRSTNPLKLYEYLALGKPVVLTDMAGYESFTGVVYISKNSAQFSDNIRQALNNIADIRTRAIAIARENNWGARVKFISGKMEKLI